MTWKLKDIKEELCFVSDRMMAQEQEQFAEIINAGVARIIELEKRLEELESTKEQQEA